MNSFKAYVWLTCHPDMDPKEWKSKFMMASEHGLSGAFLSKSVPSSIIEEAKQSGLEVHLWRMIIDRPDIFREDKRRDWYMINRNGVSCADNPPYVDYYRWLCPNHPDVLPFLKNEIIELLKIDAIDGIHLDYIRYPDVILPIGLQPKYNLVQDREFPEFDFCYCDNCREKFLNDYGKDVGSIKSPEDDKDWLEFRLKSINTIVNELSSVVSSHNKKITAAVFPTPENARSTVRQDWANWDVDSVYPMLYHGFYNENIEWIGDCIVSGFNETNHKLPIYAGLYLQDLSPEELKDTISIVKKRGGAGISLFNWNDMNPDYWKTIKEQFI